MQFKIETKEAYSIITPDSGTINAILTDELTKQTESLRQLGSKNYIVDLQYVKNIDETGLDGLIKLQQSIYNLNESLVFTCLDSVVLNAINNFERNFIINIAPTIIEAIDIVCMEILERDLMAEE